MPEPARAPYLNLISFLGAVLTTVSAVVFLVFFFLDLAGFHTNPYFGIVTFLMLPAVFVMGLLLVPIGIWRTRRRLAHGRPSRWPMLDFGRTHVRQTAAVIVALTVVNIGIVAMASFKAVEYVDSNAFCGGVCHTVMGPERVAQQRSVHANLACAQCHIGPGAPAFVEAKLGGVRRLQAVVFGSYSRPIPAPVHDLPSAEGTCASCHSPTAYIGDVIRQLKTYADDEPVTEESTTLTMNVGGGGSEGGGPRGIHWHASPQTRIEYIATDAKRETIPWVRVTDRRGEIREFIVDGVTPAQLAAGERRVMDCTDCHNRKGHAMAATPDRAVDDALARGLLSRELPFVRREAVAVLRDGSRSHATAAQQIADHFATVYGSRDTSPSGKARLAQAVAATQELYSANVFPDMNVTWGTYSDNLGHTDAPGCFRCHDDSHKTKTGLVITQDCETCHRSQQ